MRIVVRRSPSHNVMADHRRKTMHSPPERLPYLPLLQALRTQILRIKKINMSESES